MLLPGESVWVYALGQMDGQTPYTLFAMFSQHNNIFGENICCQLNIVLRFVIITERLEAYCQAAQSLNRVPWLWSGLHDGGPPEQTNFKKILDINQKVEHRNIFCIEMDDFFNMVIWSILLCTFIIKLLYLLIVFVLFLLEKLN